MRIPIVFGGIVLAVTAVAGAGLAVTFAKNHDKWTHADVANHLNKKGVKSKSVKTLAENEKLGIPSSGWLILLDKDGTDPYESIGYGFAYQNFVSENLFRVTKEADEARAKEEASVGNKSFAWHRFVFAGGTEASRKRLLAALPK